MFGSDISIYDIQRAVIDGATTDHAIRQIVSRAAPSDEDEQEQADVLSDRWAVA